MTVDFVSLIFIWLLLLKASSGQNDNFTEVMTGTQVTGNGFTHNQMTRREASTSKPLPEVSAHYITQSMMVDVNPEDENDTKPSLPTTPTKPPQTFSADIQTAATPTNSTLSLINGSTGGTKSTSATTVMTSPTSILTTTTPLPSMLSGSTQSQLINDTVTYPPPVRTQSTKLNTTTEPVVNKSTSTSPVTGGDTTQSTVLYKTSTPTAKTPFIRMATAKGRQDPPESNQGAGHGKAVAGLIGGALILMMLGFLLIYMKKRKLQRQQMTTSDWAGPSPFLEGGADDSQVTLRSSNQISLSSFLPQRLSKRLSTLPETDEDKTQGATSGDEHQVSTFGRELNGNEVKESNGTAAVVPGVDSTRDAPETVENSSQMNELLHTNNNSEVVESENPLTLSGAEENAQSNDGSEQP